MYSHVVFFPVYLSALPESSVLVKGPFGLNEATFWMIIHPLLILSMIVSLALNWRSRSRRKLVLVSFAVYFVVLVASSLFFIPELIAFSESPSGGLPPTEWLERGNRWQRLSWVRGTVVYVGILPLLFAVTKPAAGGVREDPADAGIRDVNRAP